MVLHGREELVARTFFISLDGYLEHGRVVPIRLGYLLDVETRRVDGVDILLTSTHYHQNQFQVQLLIGQKHILAIHY